MSVKQHQLRWLHGPGADDGAAEEVLEVRTLARQGSSSTRVAEGMSAPPVIVRIAGLSGGVLRAFSSPACLEKLAAHQALDRQLALARRRMVAILEAAVPESEPKARRFLLRVKRDCYNGRALAAEQAGADWASLAPLTEGLADEILSLEARVAGSLLDLERLYSEELDRERRHLIEVAQDERFLRGVALASSELVRRTRALPRIPLASFGRREARAEQSLLRYVTRAAAKLSPYSTLTAIGLGTVREGATRPAFQFVGCEWTELSLVRAQRFVLDRCLELLLLYPPVRGECQICLNDTLEELEPGRYRFLRASHQEFDAERQEFRFAPASEVRVGLAGSLVPAVKAALSTGPIRFEILIRRLAEEASPAEEGDSSSRVRAALDRLIGLGLLILRPPLATHEAYLEHRLLQFLRTIPLDPALKSVASALEALLEVESGYLAALRSEEAVRSLEGALACLIARVEALAGLPISDRPIEEHVAYEDVFFAVQGADEGEGEILQVAGGVVDEIMQTGELVSRFASLYNLRHELIHLIEALWIERWPRRREIPFLEFFREIRALWEAFIRFDLDPSRSSLSGSFNPLGITEVDSLNALRNSILEEAQRAMEECPSGKLISLVRLRRLVEEIPPRYGPICGCSVFVQPATDDGRLWVLNRLFEGTGRYFSRYCASMPEPMRSRFIGHLAPRSEMKLDGEPVELLDLVFSYGGMTNMRLPQTRKALEVPGERSALSPDQVIHLRDLSVRADLQKGIFWLEESNGRRLLPVHMSSLNHVLVPSIFRLLAVFGPFEVRQIFPRPRPRAVDGASVSDRVTCGQLVIRRKRWEIGRESINIDTSCGSEAEAYRRVQEWRSVKGLPVQLFFYEQMHQEGDSVESFKPQYLDLSSPSMVSLFLHALRKSTSRLIFEEALPSFAAFPVDPDGMRRGIEIQIDSLALRSLVSCDACGAG